MLIALRNKINVGFGGVFTVQSQYPTEPQREHVFYKAKYNIFKTMIAIVIGKSVIMKKLISIQLNTFLMFEKLVALFRSECLS
jgi:hypothetical protein